MRAQFQVLVIPFRKQSDGIFSYCIFRRSDADLWQGIAGGGEGEETPIEGAKRESLEEAGIPPDSNFMQLETTSSIPVSHFAKAKFWPKSVFIIPEYSFGVELQEKDVVLSHEHTENKWTSYKEAMSLLFFESNRTALWELNTRLCNLEACITPPPPFPEKMAGHFVVRGGQG